MKRGIYAALKMDSLICSRHHNVNLNEVDKLADSIRNCGLQSPITVWGPNDKGQATIISGYRRFLALQKVLKPDDLVPCYILASNMGDEEEHIQVEDGNLQVRQLTKEEVETRRFSLMDYLLDEAKAGNITDRDVIVIFADCEKLNERTARMYRDVAKKGHDALRTALKTGKLCILTSAKVANRIPVDHQEEVLDAIKDCRNDEQRNRIIDSYEVKYNVRAPWDIDKDIRRSEKHIGYFLSLHKHLDPVNIKRVMEHITENGTMDQFFEFLKKYEVM